MRIPSAPVLSIRPAPRVRRPLVAAARLLPARLAGAALLMALPLRPVAPAPARSPAGPEPRVAHLTAARAQCTAGARWGDVNDDGTVNILDAQQVARHSVGLSVLNAAAVAARGDVNGETGVNIIDAQQIARFSVGLSAAARINTALVVPEVATLALAPAAAPALAVGGTLSLAATPRDAANADLTACVTITWGSSAPAVASVSATGVVTGVAPGTATITATAGTRSATLTITVAGSLLPLGQAVTGLAATGATILEYTVAVPAGTPVLLLRTSGGTGEVALQLLAGTGSSASGRCFSSTSAIGAYSTNQVCALNAPPAGTYTVRLRPANTWSASSAFSGVTLEVNPQVPSVTLGQAITDLSTAAGVVLYTVQVPAGTPTLLLRTSEGSGDVELRVFAGPVPAGSNLCTTYYVEGTHQRCALNAPAAGTYTIQLRGDLTGSFRGVTLEVNPSLPAATPGQRLTGLGSSTASLLYTVAVPAGTPGLILRTSGGSGELNLRIFTGAGPAGTAACDTQNYGGAPSLLCAVAVPLSGGTYTIELHRLAGRAFSGVTLEVNPEVPTVTFGQSVAGLSSAAGPLLYHVPVPAGTDRLLVRTGGGTGPVTLRVFRGSRVPTGNPACTYPAAGSEADCSVSGPRETDDVFTVMVSAGSTDAPFSGVTMEVNPAIPVVTLGQTITGLSSGAGALYFRVNVPPGTPPLLLRTAGGSGALWLDVYNGVESTGTSSCNSSSGGTTAQECRITTASLPYTGTLTVVLRADYLRSFAGVSLQLLPQ
jgi:hypothetical protein